jgi:hypothetical protein
MRMLGLGTAALVPSATTALRARWRACRVKPENSRTNKAWPAAPSARQATRRSRKGKNFASLAPPARTRAGRGERSARSAKKESFHTWEAPSLARTALPGTPLRKGLRRATETLFPSSFCSKVSPPLAQRTRCARGELRCPSRPTDTGSSGEVLSL